MRVRKEDRGCFTSHEYSLKLVAEPTTPSLFPPLTTRPAAAGLSNFGLSHTRYLRTTRHPHTRTHMGNAILSSAISQSKNASKLA